MRSKIFVLFLGVIFASVAQRRVTPVEHSPLAKGFADVVRHGTYLAARDAQRVAYGEKGCAFHVLHFRQVPFRRVLRASFRPLGRVAGIVLYSEIGRAHV